MSKRTHRIQVAIGERAQPVGEIVFEAVGRRQASIFSYAVESLDNPERFAIAPLMPLGESQFYVSASRSTTSEMSSCRTKILRSGTFLNDSICPQAVQTTTIATTDASGSALIGSHERGWKRWSHPRCLLYSR